MTPLPISLLASWLPTCTLALSGSLAPIFFLLFPLSLHLPYKGPHKGSLPILGGLGGQKRSPENRRDKRQGLLTLAAMAQRGMVQEALDGDSFPPAPCDPDACHELTARCHYQKPAAQGCLQENPALLVWSARVSSISAQSSEASPPGELSSSVQPLREREVDPLALCGEAAHGQETQCRLPSIIPNNPGESRGQR